MGRIGNHVPAFKGVERHAGVSMCFNRVKRRKTARDACARGTAVASKLFLPHVTEDAQKSNLLMRRLTSEGHEEPWPISGSLWRKERLLITVRADGQARNHGFREAWRHNLCTCTGSSLTLVVVYGLSNECAMGSDKLQRHGVPDTHSSTINHLSIYLSPPQVLSDDFRKARGIILIIRYVHLFIMIDGSSSSSSTR